MPVVARTDTGVPALPMDRMVMVKYIGKGNGYLIGQHRFKSERKGGAPVQVPWSVWNHLRKQRNAEGLREFVLLDGQDRDVLAQDRSRSRIGDFATKRAAMEYAADQHNVQLIATLPLETMNQMTVILKQRASVGYNGEHLVDGLKGAFLLEDDAQQESNAEPELAPPPAPKKPFVAADDDDELKEYVTSEPEAEVEQPTDDDMDTATMPVAVPRGSGRASQPIPKAGVTVKRPIKQVVQM
jgi:hypothetical protein